MYWVDKKQLGKVDKEVFRYTDCLATVRAINKYYQPQRLCDIGANAGHWSYIMHQLNPRLEDVVLFEPQAKLAHGLQELKLGNASKHLYQCALGDSARQLILAGGTASASLLEADENQHHYFPGSIHQEYEQIEVRVLDDIYKNDNLAYPDVIKMDVQGYELNVLKGAKNVLAHARYLVIELSLREFYKDQPPLWELWRFLEEEQFVMVDHGHELRSPRAPHELLQFDAIFMNKRFEQS